MLGWDNFFVAEAGAAAALAGLVFVAVSINLTRVLEYPHLPARAAETLIALLSVLVVTTFALVPGQSPRAYGVEIGATGLVIWTIQTVMLVRAQKMDHQYSRAALRVLMNQLPPLPFFIAGGLMAIGHPAGVYWVVPGTLLSFAAGIFGAWVLLVEIQR
jgi:hypothetical protein